ncbi:hypothetical protein BKA57DRAFT_95867 [Linnemannia elongata]|nr:hypothetical protein BKA57DRAFT_95867 [Linnemannia elongata]
MCTIVSQSANNSIEKAHQKSNHGPGTIKRCNFLHHPLFSFLSLSLFFFFSLFPFPFLFSLSFSLLSLSLIFSSLRTIYTYIQNHKAHSVSHPIPFQFSSFSTSLFFFHSPSIHRFLLFLFLFFLLSPFFPFPFSLSFSSILLPPSSPFFLIIPFISPIHPEIHSPLDPFFSVFLSRSVFASLPFRSTLSLLSLSNCRICLRFACLLTRTHSSLPNYTTQATLPR